MTNKNISTRKEEEDDSSASSNNYVDEGQGKLYTPQHAIKLISTPNQLEDSHHETAEPAGMGMIAADTIRRNLGGVKEKILEKLSAANSVPVDALDNARNLIETVIKDVSGAAQGLTMDTLNRIKTHLVDIIPGLSPAATAKMVEEAQKEASGAGDGRRGSPDEEERDRRRHHQPDGKALYPNASSRL